MVLDVRASSDESGSLIEEFERTCDATRVEVLADSSAIWAIRCDPTVARGSETHWCKKIATSKTRFAVHSSHFL